MLLCVVIARYAVNVTKRTTGEQFLALVPYAHLLKHKPGGGGSMVMEMNNFVVFTPAAHAQVLACSLLGCSLLFCGILCCAMLCYAELCCAVLCCVLLCCVVLCCALCCVGLCVRCCAVGLCWAVLGCAVSYGVAHLPCLRRGRRSPWTEGR